MSCIWDAFNCCIAQRRHPDLETCPSERERKNVHREISEVLLLKAGRYSSPYPLMWWANVSSTELGQKSWQVMEHVINVPVVKVNGKCGLSHRGHCYKAGYDLENICQPWKTSWTFCCCWASMTSPPRTCLCWPFACQERSRYFYRVG